MQAGHRVRLAIPLLAAFALAGCGSHTLHEVSGPPSVCEVRAEAAAKAAVVERYYDEGKLGSPSAIHKTWFPGVKPSAYLQADGRMRPYPQLRGDVRLDFEAWMNEHVEVDRNRIGTDVVAAMNRVRDSSINTGKPCKQVIEPGFAVTNPLPSS